MCRGIAILKARIRQELYDEEALGRLLHERGGQAELWFDYSDRSGPVWLPIVHHGQLTIAAWGNRAGHGKLPRTGWCRRESIAAGRWQWLAPEPIEIPADFGLEKGVWFQVQQGIRGVVVRDEQQQPHAYMLTEPASHYYHVMTRHDRMPVLIDQVL